MPRVPVWKFFPAFRKDFAEYLKRNEIKDEDLFLVLSPSHEILASGVTCEEAKAKAIAKGYGCEFVIRHLGSYLAYAIAKKEVLFKFKSEFGNIQFSSVHSGCQGLSFIVELIDENDVCQEVLCTDDEPQKDSLNKKIVRRLILEFGKHYEKQQKLKTLIEELNKTLGEE